MSVHVDSMVVEGHARGRIRRGRGSERVSEFAFVFGPALSFDKVKNTSIHISINMMTNVNGGDEDGGGGGGRGDGDDDDGGDDNDDGGGGGGGGDCGGVESESE